MATYTRKNAWNNGGTFDNPDLLRYGEGDRAVQARHLTIRTKNVRPLRFLCSTMLTSFLIVGCAAAQSAPAAAPGVRMRWEDFSAGPDGAKRVKELEKAVAKMKSLDNSKNAQDFRRSWAYWANIHGYYGTAGGQPGPDGTVEQQIAYLVSNNLGQYAKYYTDPPKIQDQIPPDSVAEAVWATCQHSAGPGAQQAQNFFLWHRMYLYYFEKILQWAAGDPNFRLPYWNYTDPSDLAMPATFRANPKSALYTNKRNPGINNGSQTLSGKSTNIDSAMKIDIFLNYEYQIEMSVHGYVHCTVGPTCPVAFMGDVPVAGNDPIFYIHHANIDRLFACWEKKYGFPTVTSDPSIEQPFSFPDENGNLQTQAVSAFVDTTKLGYVYDNETSCTRSSSPLQAAEQVSSAAKASITLAKSAVVAVDRPQVSVDIAIPATSKQTLGAEAVTPTAPIYLVLRDITAQGPPGTLLDVYIAKKGSPGEKLYAGTISWFNDFGVGKHHQTPLQKTLQFDVTDQLKSLGAGNLDGISVFIQASSGTVSTKAGAAGTTEVSPSAAAAFRSEAHVKVGAIELRRGYENPSQ